MKYIFIILFIFLSLTNKAHPVVKYGERYLFVREINNNNRSAEIDSFNRAAGVPIGSSWCASYVSWVYKHEDYNAPYSAWSPHFGKSKDIIYKKNLKNNKKIEAGDAVTFYYANLKRVGHVGLVKYEKDGYLYTIEGNTNGAGSREGNGVYNKKRELNKIYAITRYHKN